MTMLADLEAPRAETQRTAVAEKNTPFWWEDAPVRPVPRQPLAKKLDVAIVGAGYAGLSAAAVVWALMLVASLGDARWAASALEFNLVLTMLLAFALPVAALLALRLDARPIVAGTGQAVVARLGTGATIASWTLLACHVA